MLRFSLFPSRSPDRSELRTLLLIGGGLLIAGVVASTPDTARGQQTGPPCSEPSPCPATDTTQNPEVTCFEPQSSPINKDVTLHIYGKHLATADTPPRNLIYRDSEMSGRMARTNDDIEVKSTCHVVSTVYVKQSRRLSEGDSVEFQLQREAPSRKEAKNGSKGTISDWHYVKLTAPEKTGQTLQVNSSAKAQESGSCKVQDPTATNIGDLSGRHHMNTVRLEGIVTDTNAETGDDEKEYALQGETGTLRVTTSASLPEVGTWYSVTGEVSFNPSEGREYLKEQDRTACK